MTIRSTTVLLTLPLFLALAVVNGALLYFQDRAETHQALNDLALVPAVTVAEFVREMDDPYKELSKPIRKQALRAALHHVAGIDGLYLLAPGRKPLPLMPGGSHWDPSALELPSKPSSFASGSGARGDRWVTALAPAGQGRFVASRFSTEPLHEHMDAVRRDILASILLLGLLATGLSLFVARRITRELEANHRQLSRGQNAPAATDMPDLVIREAQDLADALRLMDASKQAAQTRRHLVAARKQRLRDPEQAIAETQADLFPPCVVRNGGYEIAMRLCGDVEPGTFFVHALTATGGTAFIGRCRASSPVDALASAANVRRRLEHCRDRTSLERTLEHLCALYDFAALERFDWTHEAAASPILLSVADDADAVRAQVYWRKSPGIAPQALLAGLAVLLAPNGVFAAIGPAGSGDR
ncbi:hypothetical protein [Novosphingobium album (ex Hu et al. 2023)]|uniref:HAMP domain-containing protein n=1 Tax=Novosphingobium album (ex Hu et al. 2023) TaxID=2930093 RepID=A0ABT0AXD7_9SPHN|nr:hypothetical protein [Novosphingobium album (ex Hu et al. 2023)]MCJ2177487.1 hypothetical protein [Novosphingobium album (ex Hu et al. 2023)]